MKSRRSAPVVLVCLIVLGRASAPGARAASEPEAADAAAQRLALPPEWGKALHDEYTAKRYHQPSDEYSPDMDFTADAAMARFGFALGWQALTAGATVGWQRGDEFEAKRQAR